MKKDIKLLNSKINRLTGREIDAAIWFVRMGKKIELRKCRYVDGDVQPHGGYPLGHISPHQYHNNVHAVVELLEEAEDAGFDWLIGKSKIEKVVWCKLHLRTVELHEKYGALEFIGYGNTIPEAVCHAFLLMSWDSD